jgi:iron uptake system EfeUOB component EfeO/EfeM
MGLSSPDHERRQKALENVNGAEAAIKSAAMRLAAAEKKYQKLVEEHQRLLNDTKSEIGTAKRELGKAHGRYAEMRAHLFKLVPDTGLGPVEDDELAAE